MEDAESRGGAVEDAESRGGDEVARVIVSFLTETEHEEEEGEERGDRGWRVVEKR